MIRVQAPLSVYVPIGPEERKMVVIGCKKLQEDALLPFLYGSFESRRSYDNDATLYTTYLDQCRVMLCQHFEVKFVCDCRAARLATISVAEPSTS
jgi:hypothetical protein